MTPDTSPTERYWAFVSYSSKDKKWGKWLHSRLENYPIPKEFRGKEIFDGDTLGKNLRPCFRDRDELSGAAQLGTAIESALENSRFLVVLCSKNSAKSKWVNREIETFKNLRPENEKRILALILDGSPNATSSDGVDDSEECYPPALQRPAEPLAGDLRKQGDGKERGFLKILAGIAEIGFDQLYRRHERNQRRKRITLATAASLVIAALASLSIFALHQKSIAEDQRTQAESSEAKAVEQEKITKATLTEARHRQAISAIERGDYYEAMPYAVAFHKLTEGSEASTALLFSLLTHKVPQAPTGPPIQLPQEPTAVSSDASGQQLLTAGFGMPIQLWNLKTHSLIAQQALPATDLPQATQFTPDNQGISHWSSSSNQLLIWQKDQLGKAEPKVVPATLPGTMTPVSADGESIIWYAGGESSSHVDEVLDFAIPSELPGLNALKTICAFGDLEAWTKTSQESLMTLDAHIDFQQEHDEPITRATLSPRGQFLATGDASGRIILWDTKEKKAQHRLELKHPIAHFNFSPDQGHLLVVHTKPKPEKPEVNQETSLIIELATGQVTCQSSLDLHNTRLVKVSSITNGGRFFAIARSKGIVSISDAQAAPDEQANKVRWINSKTPPIAIHLDPTGTFVHVASTDGTVRTYDVNSTLFYANQLNQKASLTHFGWSRDQSQYWLVDDQHTIRTYHSRFLASSRILLTHQHALFDTRFHPSGEFLVTLSHGNDKDHHQTWSTKTWLPLHPPIEHSSPISSVHFSSSTPDTLALLHENDGAVSFYDIRSGQSTQSPSASPVRSKGKQLGISLTRLSKNGSCQVSSSIKMAPMLSLIGKGNLVEMQNKMRTLARSIISIVRTDDPKIIELPIDGSQIIDFQLSHDGETIIAVGMDYTEDTSFLLIIEHDQITRRLDLDAAPRKLSLSPDETRACIHSGSTGAILVNLETLKVIAHLPHRQMVNHSEFSHPTSDTETPAITLVTASDDGTAKLWDATTGASLTPPLVHPSGSLVISAAFSPDGRWVATGGSNKAVIIWEVQSGKQVSIPLSTSTNVLEIDFSPDGQWIAATSRNQSARVFEWLPANHSPAPELIEDVIAALCDKQVDQLGNVSHLNTWPTNLRLRLEELPNGTWKNALTAPFTESANRKVTPSSNITTYQDILRAAKCDHHIGDEPKAASRRRLAKQLIPLSE